MVGSNVAKVTVLCEWIRTGFVSQYALCVYIEAFDELGLFRPHGLLSS